MFCSIENTDINADSCTDARASRFLASYHSFQCNQDESQKSLIKRNLVLRMHADLCETLSYGYIMMIDGATSPI